MASSHVLLHMTIYPSILAQETMHPLVSHRPMALRKGNPQRDLALGGCIVVPLQDGIFKT